MRVIAGRDMGKAGRSTGPLLLIPYIYVQRKPCSICSYVPVSLIRTRIIKSFDAN